MIAIALLLLSSSDWELAAKEDGVTVYSKSGGENVAEMKAIGLIDAPPQEVWKIIRDYDNYKKTMPYTEESRILAREDGDKVIYFYSVVNAPLVDKRDYTIRLVDESDWKDGKGYLLVRWTASDKGPPPRKDFIRVKLNNGYWKLEPRDGGQRTFATYYVHTDPGGSIPRWIANRANTTAVPNVFLAIRKAVAEAKKSASR